MDLRVWRVRSYLALLLVATMLVSFAIVGSAILLVRIPQLERSSKEEVAREVEELTGRVEILLGSLESRMELLSLALQTVDLVHANALLDRAAGDGQSFGTIFLASKQGKVLAVGVPPALRAHREDALGSDLSANPMFRQVLQRRQIVWGDKYMSALSGSVTVGLAYPVGDDTILLAEVPLTYLLDTFRLAAGQRNATIWLLDGMGEIIADTERGRFIGVTNMRNLPPMQAAMRGAAQPDVFSFEGRRFHSAVSHFTAVDWYFMGGIPAGMENRQIRETTWFVVLSFAGALLVGLLLAPYWASWLTRHLQGLVARARQITLGAAGGPWPRGPIAEFNKLSSDLEKMAATQQERGQKVQAIFNAAPMPMSVTAVDQPTVLLEVNDAWCTVFDRRREDVLRCSVSDIHLWPSMEELLSVRAQLEATQGSAHAWMRRGDGRLLRCLISRQRTQIGTAQLFVWSAIDITALHRVQGELRDLNTELEARVERRTEALASLNAELSGAITRLQETQGELVRAEKMAALGSLVAGVAHELNTPLGNGLMAVSALSDEVRQFRLAMQDGLRRTALEELLASAEQGTGIAMRNLHRAADLVASFKQVAVDQTSAQRRRFALAEVVDEMVVSLRPSFARTAYRIVVDVPADIWLDSYPGALGQVLGNLINNAVLHGFEDRAHGSIHISGMRGEGGDAGNTVLRVADDGRGIPAALVDRIFDPFVTTKMGRGGTGLGLHIAYNAVVHALGGSMVVHSVEGEGTTFEIRLPDVAPRASESATPV